MPKHNYRPQRSCGNVMVSQASVILFTEGVLCPSMHQRSHDQGVGVSVQGALCLGGLCPRGVSVQGGLCLCLEISICSEGGFSVPACTTGHMTRGKGVSVQGCSLSGGLCPRKVSVWGSLSLSGDHYLGGLCPGGLCLCLGSLSGGSLSRGSLSGGSLSRGISVWRVSVWEVSVPGGFCLGVSVQWDLCPGGSLSRGSLSRGSLLGRPSYGNEQAVLYLLECILV